MAPFVHGPLSTRFVPPFVHTCAWQSFDVTMDAMSPASRNAYNAPTPSNVEVKARRKSQNKQRRASQRVALANEEKRRTKAATIIRGLLFIHRARQLANFFRINPALIKEGHGLANSIQASWRGTQSRKR